MMAAQNEERWVAGFDRWTDPSEPGELLCGTIVVKETAKQCVVVDRRHLHKCLKYGRIFPKGAFHKSKREALQALRDNLITDVRRASEELYELQRRLETVDQEIKRAD